MILIINNYDSFVHTIADYVRQANQEVMLFKNDDCTISDIQALNPTHIILSPGPKHPKDAGICIDIILHLGKTIPILGVCLGHQALAYAFGGDIIRSQPMHGKADTIIHSHNSVLFKNIPTHFMAGRYHSLSVSDKDLPECLKVTGRNKEEVIMSIEHNTLPLYGLQFHPESVLSEYGHKILENFLCS